MSGRARCRIAHPSPHGMVERSRKAKQDAMMMCLQQEDEAIYLGNKPNNTKQPLHPPSPPSPYHSTGEFNVVELNIYSLPSVRTGQSEAQLQSRTCQRS